VKRLAVVLAATVAVIAAAVVSFRAAGFRVALDGTGYWPRFVSKAPDYDALEADRARQRVRSAASAASSPPTGLVATASSSPASAEPVGPAVGASTAAAAPASARRPAPSGAIAGPRPAREEPPREYWSDFRGPFRDGRSLDAHIRTDWPSGGLPLLWKQPIGLGYASFVVSDGRAFTIEQRRQQEVVAAYEVETGRELWTHVWNGEFAESMGGDGPRATPTLFDGKVYALGALGELRCLQASSGELVWRRNILEDNGATNLTWGMAAAPLVVDGQVIVLPGGPNGKSIAAYDAMTGAPRWTSLDDPQAYTSPMLVTLAGVRQILVVSARRAMGVTTDGGKLLWEYPWVNYMGISVAQPLLLGSDRVFLSAGYGHGAAVFDVTRTADTLSARTVWSNLRMKNKFTSSVLHKGYIYGLDETILACLDAASGEQKWKGGRYGYGQVLLAGDYLVVLAENGELALVSATPDGYREMARFSAISGKTWNHPVIVDGRLLVRNVREMAAFDIRPTSR
jgi:outer membrane protein assembly factor BamB